MCLFIQKSVNCQFIRYIFQIKNHGKDKVDGQHGIILRWLKELNKQDLGTNLDSAVLELNSLCQKRTKITSLFRNRFVYAIHKENLPKIPDFPDLKEMG